MNLITTAAAAAILGISPRGVQKLIERGRLPAVAVNSRLNLIDPKALEKWRTRKTRAPRKAS